MGLVSSALIFLGCFCTGQKAGVVTERVGAWNTAGPHDLSTQPLFFTPASFLGSAGRALRWCPQQRRLRTGTVISPATLCGVLDPGLWGTGEKGLWELGTVDRGGTLTDVQGTCFCVTLHAGGQSVQEPPTEAPGFCLVYPVWSHFATISKPSINPSRKAKPFSPPAIGAHLWMMR